MWSIVIGDEPQTKRITARMLLAIAEQQGMADHPILVSLGGGQATFVAQQALLVQLKPRYRVF